MIRGSDTLRITSAPTPRKLRLTKALTDGEDNQEWIVEGGDKYQ